MKKQNKLSRHILAFFALAMFALFVRCQDEMVVEPGDTEPTTDKAALEKLVDEDSSLTSFDYNYDEEGSKDYYLLPHRTIQMQLSRILLLKNLSPQL
ncbi:MAG: hypothetical protein MUE91_06095 [Ignavibacteriaceae bacterium]|nr:hypothetical protein [Ignavibacteriaceae bacterium]